MERGADSGGPESGGDTRGFTRIAVRLRPAHPNSNLHGPPPGRAAGTQMGGHRLRKWRPPRPPSMDEDGRTRATEDKESFQARATLLRPCRFLAEAQARLEVFPRDG